MNHIPEPQATQTPTTMDRRRFLTMVGGSAVASATALACGTRLPEPGTPVTSADGPGQGLAAGKTLVVIELQGGNDGLAMLQPFDDGILRDRRPRLVAEAAELIAASDSFGWHPSLAGVVEAGAAAVVGIGSDQPSFSHFEMENRWWRGDSRSASDWTTGIFGRMCDQLDAGQPVTGLSLAGGPSPGLTSEKAVTVGLVHPDANWFLQEDAAWFAALRSAQQKMAQGQSGTNDSLAAARHGLTDAISFSASLAEADFDGDNTYPWTDLGQQLRFAIEVLALDVGVRVLHVRQGGYDTHAGQGWRYGELMNELNDATTIFIDDLKQRDLWQNTLIMTTSEFGRRLSENEGGTDHGSASTAMLIGEGLSGVYGDAPDLGKLDDGNPVATARFEDYYATVAQGWFGLDAVELLGSGSSPVFDLR